VIREDWTATTTETILDLGRRGLLVLWRGRIASAVVTGTISAVNVITSAVFTTTIIATPVPVSNSIIIAVSRARTTPGFYWSLILLIEASAVTVVLS